MIILIQLTIAGLHLVNLGQIGNDTWYRLYTDYFSDLVIPFGFYFLLYLVEVHASLFRHWWMKGVVVFGTALSAEILQLFGVYALGTTFDPLDILMYAVGTSLAILVDQLLFLRLFRFWSDQ